MIEILLKALIAASFLAQVPPSSDCVTSKDGLTVTCNKPDTVTISAGNERQDLIGCPLVLIGMNESGGYKGPVVVVSKDCQKKCNLEDFSKAASRMASFLSVSDEIEIKDSVYRSPAATLRLEADRMEVQDKAIKEFRDQLKNCDWMDDPGAFERE